jgi:hypothetical protein
MNMSNPNMGRFVSFVLERENIRLRRNAKVPQEHWTADEILKLYRFCNVRRRDDRVSQWLLNNYYPQFKGGDVWFAAVPARFFNWPPTLKHLMEKRAIPRRAGNYRPDTFLQALQSLPAKKKLFTGAYVIGGNRAFPGVEKADFVARQIMVSFVQHAPFIRQTLQQNSIQAMVEFIRNNCYATKEFMAGQIVADLTYLPGVLDEATDLYTWAPRGPGSMHGLCRVLGLPLHGRFTSPDFCEALVRLRLELIRANANLSDLTLHDVQNCLCEFDKYMRVVTGEGRPRSIYRPETAY